MKKILSYALSVLVLFSGMLLPAHAIAQESEVEVSAASCVLMCIDTGEVVFEDNANERRSPASVTKIMSILLMLEAIDSGKISLDDEVSATENAQSMGGSQIWLEVGESMTVDELLRAVIIASANDACTALGEYIAGSSTAFVKMMNDRAAELGLQNTNFENCTGLDDDAENHYSSAYDLAVIACEVMQYDLVQEYSTVWLDYLRGGETELNNTNKLVNTYDGITGLKTGTTSKAGFCLAATATRGDISFVAVVLGSETSEERFDSATALLDWGFANYETVSAQIDESKITPVSVKNGTQKTITPQYIAGEKIMVKKGEGEITYDYQLETQVQAPVKAGDSLGSITLYSNGEAVKTIELTAPHDVEVISFSFIFKSILKNI
ncbi:MAG: D-alanyl-D-alanine carboxypeptidase [Clostridiales bacterium]|nr:D-alanyl-D-alanine carboxypeptidase [Clostridiales bacterium]